MPRPSSIRTAHWLLYLNILFSLFILTSNVMLLIRPTDEYRDQVEKLTGGQIASALLNLALPILVALFTVIFIRRRRRMPAILAAFVMVLFFLMMGNTIQLILGLGTVFMLFSRTARGYFEQTAAAGAGGPIEVRGEVVEVGSSEPDGREPQHGLPEQTEEQAPSQAAVTQAMARAPRKDPEVEIRHAGPDQADVIHTLMIAAFEEYRTAIPPSSALEETADTVRESLRAGQEAAILYEDERPVAMVRFQLEGDIVTFFRLSVLPARRRRGYGKQLVKWVERYGIGKGMNVSRCKVRQTVQNNVAMYQDMGYEIVDQELVVRPAGTVKAVTMEKKLGV